MATTETIGVFGGTFNPIHLAHLRAAEEAREALALDEVRFVPSASPPHKNDATIVEAADRLRMVDLAIAGVPGFRSWDIELGRAGPSYSVDTLRALRAEVGGAARIVFLIGRDAFAELHTWKDFETLFTLADFAVMTRPPATHPLVESDLPVATQEAFCYDPDIAGFRHESGHRVISLAITGLDVSASDIRHRIAEGRSVRFLVPDAVEQFVHQHRLYRSGRTPS